MICQECGGSGKYVEEVIEYWARYEQCGWCKGAVALTLV